MFLWEVSQLELGAFSISIVLQKRSARLHFYSFQVPQ